MAPQTPLEQLEAVDIPALLRSLASVGDTLPTFAESEEVVLCTKGHDLAPVER